MHFPKNAALFLHSFFPSLFFLSAWSSWAFQDMQIHASTTQILEIVGNISFFNVLAPSPIFLGGTPGTWKLQNIKLGEKMDREKKQCIIQAPSGENLDLLDQINQLPVQLELSQSSMLKQIFSITILLKVYGEGREKSLVWKQPSAKIHAWKKNPISVSL